MIIATVVIDTHHRLPDGSEGIHFKHQISWRESDKPAGIELAQLIRDRLLQGARAAAEIEGVRIIEDIYPPEASEEEEPTKPLEPDLAAALVVAKQEFTGLTQLVQHSPRHIAEIHLATLLRNYFSQSAMPLVHAANTLADTVEQLSEANDWMGITAAQVLELLQPPSSPYLRAVAIAILEAMTTPEDEQHDWMDPLTPPPASEGNKSKKVLGEIIKALPENRIEFVGYTTLAYDHTAQEWELSSYAAGEPNYEVNQWKYLPAEEKETDE